MSVISWVISGFGDDICKPRPKPPSCSFGSSEGPSLVDVVKSGLLDFCPTPGAIKLPVEELPVAWGP